MDETRLRLEIRGRVQGVGYRWAMVEKARALGLGGWVRNRCDGSVEAVVAGPPEAVDRMLAWARSGPVSARVESVDVHAHAADAGDTRGGFEPRPTV